MTIKNSANAEFFIAASAERKEPLGEDIARLAVAQEKNKNPKELKMPVYLRHALENHDLRRIMKENHVDAFEALKRLKEGNKSYLDAVTGAGDISPEKRRYTSINGQAPFAVIVSCSDSRVIPECIFSAGIGDLFVIRVAGNVIDRHQLGSIEYAVEHLHSRLVVVLGHTGCGAVGAALQENGGYIKSITDEIKRAIGTETDGTKASILNVEQSVAEIQKCLGDTEGVLVAGALYHTESGIVEFL